MNTTVKMPLSINGQSVRYELELRKSKGVYEIVLLLFMSNKLKKCNHVVSTDDIEAALDYYRDEVIVLLTIYNLP